MGTKGIKTRQQIVAKSLQLFSVKGYFNTSISDILEATHITKGGLYGHFGSKEDIWKAVYVEVHTHTYGLLSPFFQGLKEGKLKATFCPNKKCPENLLWIPPRAHCSNTRFDNGS